MANLRVFEVTCLVALARIYKEFHSLIPICETEYWARLTNEVQEVLPIQSTTPLSTNTGK